MHLPISLRESITQQLGITITEVKSCAGGDINGSAQLITPSDKFFVKWHPNSPSGMFSAEAKGLKLLRHANALSVPEVIAVQEATSTCSAYLVLGWLERGIPQPTTEEQLGTGLAILHQIETAQHGLDHDNFIGSLPQSNRSHATWPDFYAEERIRPQMEIARHNGQLPAPREKNLHKLIEKLPALLSNAPPSLLHGDLWRGNVMVLEGGYPAIIDPAVYYGHREVEIAFTELFGGFDFYRTYNTIYPLPKDYAARRSLYQLYPLMVHMNLFGGGYGQSVDAILHHYLA